MHDLYDKNAPKKATNLSINSGLLAEARNLKINLSATLEQALETEIRVSKAESWARENKAAIEACNDLTDEHGLFADKHRGF